MDQLINIIGILGSLTFAMSGAVVAMRKRFDAFGIIVIAFVSAVGGGTIRDVMLPHRDVFWLIETDYLYYIIGGAILTMIFTKLIEKRMQYPLLIFDAIGLGLFTIAGIQIGLQEGLSAISSVIIGTITGCFGGVVRDILVNEEPVIFKKDIYATISLAGGGLYFLLDKLEVPMPYLQIAPIVFIILLRVHVIFYKVGFPSIYRNKKRIN